MNMEYVLFDVVIAALLILAVVQGYKRGFVLTLCGFLAVFVALIGAAVVSDLLAPAAAGAIRPAMEQGIQDTVSSYYQTAVSEGSSQAEGFLDDLPLEEVVSALQDSALYRGFAQAFQEAVDSGVAEVTAGAARAIAEYVALQIARMVIFLAAFVVILLLWILLSRALDLAFRLPVLSTLNSWAGAGVGLLKGGLLLFVAAWLLGDFLPPEAVQGTVLLRFFCTTSPLSLIV